MATQNTAMDNAALIKEVNEAHKHKKYSVGYHAQTVVAVIVTLIMLFPLYWMIATSFKSAEEVQLVIPTLFPHEFHPENYLNVHPHLHHVCQLEPVRYVPGPDFAGSSFRLLHLHAAEHVHVH